MIDDAMRGGLLAQFPAALPLTVLTTRPDSYAHEIEQGRPLTIVDVAAEAPALEPISGGYVVLDGLDDVDDPERLLGALRRSAGGARVFALVANGASAAALARFVGGAPHPSARPLVRDDLAPLFARGGWRTVDCVPIVDATAPAGPVPFELKADGVTFPVRAEAVAERLRTAGFLVVADPA